MKYFCHEFTHFFTISPYSLIWATLQFESCLVVLEKKHFITCKAKNKVFSEPKRSYNDFRRKTKIGEKNRKQINLQNGKMHFYLKI